MRELTLLLLAGSVIGAGVSCSSPVSPGTALQVTRLQTDPTAFAHYSGYQQPATLVVRDQAAWASTWATIYQDVTPPPPLPDVDFSTEMIVGVALGMKSDSGADVVITGASEAGGTVTVGATETIAASACVTAPVVTSPVDLARIAIQAGTITSQVSIVTKPCS